MNEFIFYNAILVFGFGIIVGISEILNRYPEAKYLLKTARIYWITYLIFNGVISVFALFCLWSFKEKTISSITSIEFGAILLAGFSGMSILRSSLFSIELKGKKIDVGLSQIIKIFLDVIDRKISNSIAPLKLQEVAKIVNNKDFETYKNGIVALSSTFTNYFTDYESKALQSLIDDLSTDSTLNNRVKMLKLGSEVSKYCDSETLKEIVEILCNEDKKVSESSENLDYYINKLQKKEDHG